jgi:hypothetical protein
MKKFLKTINQKKFYNFIIKNQRIILFAICFVVSLIVLYYRYPAAYQKATFFAEDGDVFTKNIFEKGYLQGIFTRFNGYYIVGIYMITTVPIMIYEALNLNFYQIPKLIVIMSFLGFAFISTLHILIFYKKFDKATHILLTMILVLMPFGEHDHIMLGVIGNLKFSFAYVAFLLTIYRIQENKISLLKALIIDSIILLCCYTNISAYIFLPIIGLDYLWRFYKEYGLQVSKLKQFIVKNLTVLSYMSILLLSLVQVIIIKLYGLPKFEKYFPGPYDYSKSIEIFLGRTYFAILHQFYESLNDLLIIVITVLLGIIVVKFYKRISVTILSISAYSIFFLTFLLVLGRPGIHIFFGDYPEYGGQPQFFHAQNLIFSFIFVLVFYQIIKGIKKKTIRYILVVIMFLFVLIGIPSLNSFKKEAEYNSGNIWQNTYNACSINNDEKVQIPIDPPGISYLIIDREIACDGL